MAGKRRASPVKRLNVSHRMIKSNSSDTVFELERYNVWGVFTTCSMIKLFSLQIENRARLPLFWKLIKTYNLASAYSSISVLSVWQVHNRSTVYGCNQFWYRVPYPWTLWRGRLLTQHQRLLRKKGSSEVANCWILANMKQEGRSCIIIISCPRAPWTQNGLIMILCGWWRCFAAPQNSLESPQTLRRHFWTTFAWLLWSPFCAGIL